MNSDEFQSSKQIVSQDKDKHVSSQQHIVCFSSVLQLTHRMQINVFNSVLLISRLSDVRDSCNNLSVFEFSAADSFITKGLKPLIKRAS